MKHCSMFRPKVINSRSTCVSISDGSLLPLIAARLGANKVIYLEILFL